MVLGTSVRVPASSSVNLSRQPLGIKKIAFQILPWILCAFCMHTCSLDAVLCLLFICLVQFRHFTVPLSAEPDLWAFM